MLLFSGVAAILAAASLIGFALAHRFAESPVVGNLNARIKAWWVMVALIGLAFALGKAGVIVLFALASFAALREFLTLTRTRRGDHLALATAFFIILPLQYYLIWIEWYGLYSILIPVYVFLTLPVVAALRGDTTRFMRRIADVLQYVWSKLFGRHPIAPSLSPSKTVEGFVGGVASATLLGAALWWITPFSPWQAALMALVINLMGFCGGLVMSAIKRDRGVKDWGQMIEGHGGMLDRLDSVVFVAPIFFHLTRYWWTP